jgi:two-component system, OmpR family, sensor histidine kinase MtrB
LSPDGLSPDAIDPGAESVHTGDVIDFDIDGPSFDSTTTEIQTRPATPATTASPETPPTPETPETHSGSMPPEYVERTVVLDHPARLEPAKLPWKLPARLARLSIGLRSRAALAIGLGALVISVAVAMLTYIVARRSLVEERRSVIQQLVFADAVQVQKALASKVDISSVLKSQIRNDLQALVVQGPIDPQKKNRRRPSFVSSPTLSEFDIPEKLRERTSATAQHRTVGSVEYLYQVTRIDGRSVLVIAVPLPVVEAEFYGVARLNDVEKRLRNLAQTLTVAALLTSIGSALVGRGVSRRVLRPLASVAAAAGGISSGRLDTRLELTGDPDLDPLLGSFNDMASSLQSRIEREARFASDVSHELRTPLTALVTAARLLDGRRDELGERGQKTLDVLVTQTTHFERLVLDLLEMSRFDAGAATLHAEMVNLPDLLRQIVELNDSEAVVVNESLNPIEIGLDKRRVERMVANLLQNAANYADGAVDVVMSQVPGPNGERRVRISVGDHGPGVPSEERDSIFERFRRGQSHMRGTSAQKGTGLGLSLVRAHANLHFGTVWVEDNSGGGARFVLDIAELEVTE